MVSEEMHYPLSRKRALQFWEWHLLLYWDTVMRDFPNVPLAHLDRLPRYSKSLEEGWTWVAPARTESLAWRMKFLGAKLGLTRAISVDVLPEWLLAVVSIRFLDEPMVYFGRPMKTFPARAAEFQLA
jgi:hypothetical protein